MTPEAPQIGLDDSQWRLAGLMYLLNKGAPINHVKFGNIVYCTTLFHTTLYDYKEFQKQRAPFNPMNMTASNELWSMYKDFSRPQKTILMQNPTSTPHKPQDGPTATIHNTACSHMILD